MKNNITDKQKLKLLTVIKQEKLHFIKLLEKEYDKSFAFDEDDDRFDLIQSDIDQLQVVLKQNSKNFYQPNSISDDKATAIFENFFGKTRDSFAGITDTFIHYKKTNLPDSDDLCLGKYLFTIILCKSIIDDYLKFLDKFECAVLGLHKNEIIFNFQLAEFLSLLEFLVKIVDEYSYLADDSQDLTQTTKNNKSTPSLLWLAGAFGLGFLFGDDDE
ncbi:MAG: hypothetical protein DRQ51_06710 [Gammaproteobacteria bacterium]|nr:MAG: hypothetical protein DRQ51_06710 [Gammaproteobacteria bacterium]